MPRDVLPERGVGQAEDQSAGLGISQPASTDTAATGSGTASRAGRPPSPIRRGDSAWPGHPESNERRTAARSSAMRRSKSSGVSAS